MPYPTIPSKPTLGGRWDSWGDALDASVRQLASDVAALAAAPAPVVARSPFVKPTSATAWPKQTRTSADTLMWLRQWDASTLAPLPTKDDGYLDGDLVYPVAAGTSLPGTTSAGVLFSDSLSVSTTVDLDGRFGDKALGGSEPTWRGDTTGTSDSRARVQPTSGLEMYSASYAYVITPKLPAGDVRYSWRIGALAVNNSGQLRVRGASYNAPGVAVRVLNSAGTLNVTVEDATSGSVVTTTLGTAPFTARQTAMTVTIIGQTLTVAVDGTTLTPFTIPAAAQRMPYACWYAPTYHSYSIRDVKVEAL